MAKEDKGADRTHAVKAGRAEAGKGKALGKAPTKAAKAEAQKGKGRAKSDDKAATFLCICSNVATSWLEKC